jgi:hypothetical protein
MRGCSAAGLDEPLENPDGSEAEATEFTGKLGGQLAGCMGWKNDYTWVAKTCRERGAMKMNQVIRRAIAGTLIVLGLLAVAATVVGTVQAKPKGCRWVLRVWVCEPETCGEGCAWDPEENQCECGSGRDCGKDPYKWNPYSYGFQRRFSKWCEQGTFDEREVMYSGQWCNEVACAEGFKPAEFCDFSEGGAPPEMWTCPEPASPALAVSGVEPSPFGEQ